jgi:hypothetical protein
MGHGCGRWMARPSPSPCRGRHARHPDHPLRPLGQPSPDLPGITLPVESWRPRRSRRPGPLGGPARRPYPSASHQPLADRSPAAPPYDEPLGVGSGRFRLRRCRRPIRSLRGPGKRYVLGATAEGPGPPRGAAAGRISSAAPSTYRLTGSVNPNTVLPRVPECSPNARVSRQRHRGNSGLPRLVGAPRPPWTHRPTVGWVIGPGTGAVGRLPARSRPRPPGHSATPGSRPGQTGPG